jgi:DNA-binding NarL/FixJ family response regulator
MTAQEQPATSHAANGRVDAVITWTAGGQRVELSQRQSQVLEWLLAGRSNRDIAELMHLSEGTVKNHVSNLLLLFSVRSRTQLMSVLR